ncbi:hypothetical protein [Planomonospora algeriensis]
MPLITIERFEAATGGTLDVTEKAKAQVLLEDVSFLVQSFTGRDFQWHQNETITYWGDGSNQVVFPHAVKPVLMVHSVTIDGSPVTDYQITQYGLALKRAGFSKVDIVCDYGYESVPGDVQAVVLAETLYKFNADPGINQEQVGDLVTGYSAHISALSRDAKKALRKYRPPFKVVRL